MSKYLFFQWTIASIALLAILGVPVALGEDPVVPVPDPKIQSESDDGPKHQNETSSRNPKDLSLQSLDEKKTEAAEKWVKPPTWINIDTLLAHPEWILNETEPDFENKILGITDLFSDCLENWEAPRILQTTFPYYHAGYDDDNRAVWIAEAGKFNVRKIVEEGGPNLAALDKYMRQAGYRIMKSIMSRLSQQNRNIEVRFLLDFDGLNVAQLIHLPTVSYGIKYARRFSRIMSNHVGPSVVINANYATETALNIAKPIMPLVLANVEVYGTNKAKWLPRLRQHFPNDILPEWYGGTKHFVPINIYGRK